MVRYSDELIDEIRNSNDIVDIISQYVVLKRSGRNFFGLCPFHKEKSPSFSVSPDKQIFHCFGCGAGGNVVHFVSKIENIDFRETLELLAKNAGITLPTLDSGKDDKMQKLKSKVYEINEFAAQFYHARLYEPTSKLAQEYIKKRKLTNNTLKTYSIGYAGNFDELYKFLKSKGFTEEELIASCLVSKTEKGTYIDRFRKRLMIPIKDTRNRVIAFGGRVLDDSKPKYINSSENIVYSKGRQLFGLNVAKNGDTKKIIIVEGYMDAISLYQRGITNVVASLGTALTESQGRLLRKYTSEIVIGYDSDGAGQAATLRGLEILYGLGYDVRILQMEGAKDPDEFVIKFGSARFNQTVDKAISLIEFKVKVAKADLDLDVAGDKIKFLNEVSNILSKVDNNMEKEVYIDKISQEYKISKEAIYAQTNKLMYANNKGAAVLQKPTVSIIKKTEESPSAIFKRENLLISLLINPELHVYEKIKEKIDVADFKLEKNQRIVKMLYEQYENGSRGNVLDIIKEEDLINHITGIMAEDFEIASPEKALEDVLQIYEKEKTIDEKNSILKKLEDVNLTENEKASLENKLKEVMLRLTKIK